MGSRVIGWEQRLDAALADSRPFAWRESDCCTFAARCIEAVTGGNPAASMQYVDWFGAGRILRRYGGVEGVATKLFGPSKPALCAGRGDLVMLDKPHRMLGICAGHLIAVQGAQGVEYCPLSSGIMAWSI